MHLYSVLFDAHRRRWASLIAAWLLAALPLLGQVPAVPAAVVPAVAPMQPAMGPRAWTPPRPKEAEAVISKVVGQMLPRFHYERLPMDAAVSEKWFDNYFDHLDRERSFFLAADLQEFSTFRDLLSELLLTGRVDVAYAVYARLVERVRDRVEFARAYLQTPVDFTADEYFVTDRAKAPWCATRAELDQVWRLRLKNQLLATLLQDEAERKRDAETTAAAAKTPPATPPPATGSPAVTPAPAPQTAAVADPPKPPRERVLQFYAHLLEALEQKDSFDILEVYLNALTQVYDPHSNYLSPDSEEDFDISMRLTLQGIGAVLTSDDGYVKIMEIMPGGPADLDGRLQAGDRIVAVGQANAEPQSVINLALSKVVKRIRGPKGTTVTLWVVPADRSRFSPPVALQLTRDEVKLTEQEAKLEIKTIPGAPGRQVAVIELPAFYAEFKKRDDGKPLKRAASDVRRLLGEAAKQQVVGVVLDLRSDGGGSLDEAVKVAGFFFDHGPVVQVRDAERDLRVLTDDDQQTVFAGPLVVLVNRLSASASEIVAAALQDYRRAVIIGDASTHGKGTVQTVYRLDELLGRANAFQGLKTGSLKFTVAKFYRVDGGSTQRKGVVSDIAFPSFADFLDLGESELPAALAWDEVNPVPVTPGLDVRPWLPTLLTRSKARLATDADYLALTRQVTRFGELRKIKELPLNREKRELLQAEEDAFSKKVESLASGRRASARAKAKLKPGETPVKPGRDLMLDEALAVIGDMLALQAGTLKPVPTPSPSFLPVLAKTEKTP